MNDLAQKNGFTVQKTPSGPWTPQTPNYTKQSSAKVKPGGDETLVGSLTWTMSGCFLAAYTFVSGAGSMSPTATKVKCQGQTPFRKGDQGNCAGSFTLTASPFTPLPCACTFQIDAAGQTKVRSE